MKTRLIHPAFPSSYYLQRLGRVFACLFLGFGSVFFFLAIAPWLPELQTVLDLKSRGVITTGTITETRILSMYGNTNPAIYLTRYEFEVRAPQQSIQQVQGEVQHGVFNRYQDAQPIEIVYLPDDPLISKPLAEFPFSSFEIDPVLFLVVMVSLSLAGFLILEAAVLQRLRIAKRLDTQSRFGFGRVVELPEAASTEIIYEYGPSHLIRQGISSETYQALQVGDLVIVRYLEDNPAHARAEQCGVRLITIW